MLLIISDWEMENVLYARIVRFLSFHFHFVTVVNFVVFVCIWILNWENFWVAFKIEVHSFFFFASSLSADKTVNNNSSQWAFCDT